MEVNSNLTLYNAVKIPAIGFGTWQIPNGEIAHNAVSFALKNGYRHIDTANSYGNEESVGRAIRDSGISRSEIFVTSKLPAWIKTYKETLESFDITNENLGLDYVDLYLIHSPWPWGKSGMDFTKQNIEVWKAFEEIYKRDRCRAIGVSNFKVHNLSPILKNCEIRPMVNQISFFIGKSQHETYRFCKENNIVVEGYSPLASGALLENKGIERMAHKYQTTIPKICIRYVLQKGVIPITKSIHADRIIQNKDVNFEIAEGDMKYLDGLKNTVKQKPGLLSLKRIHRFLRRKASSLFNSLK
jgi:diketogulonate reductase-like aldo/keto reductase